MTISLRSTMTAPPAVGPWPGTTTQTNVDWEKQQQQQMQEALQGLGTLVSQAEAAQFARQQEADRLQSQLAAASAAPLSPPSLAMALPYAAAQFSSALSGRPEVGQQADQSLALNRAQQLQRRAQLLDTLANQHQEAARRAEQAGNLTDALKFNTKANMLLKQLDEAGTGLREAKKTAVDQTFEAWKTQYNAKQEYARALLYSSSTRDPALAARIGAIDDIYNTKAAPLKKQLEFLTKPEQRAPIMAQLDSLSNERITATELAIAGHPFFKQAPVDTAAPPPPAPRKANIVQRAVQGAFGATALQPAAADSAEVLLRRTFPGQSPKEVMDWLRRVDPASGQTNGHLLGQKYGVSFGNLMTGARRISRGGGGKF